MPDGLGTRKQAPFVGLMHLDRAAPAIAFLGLALAASACSVIAGYTDLHLASAPDASDAGLPAAAPLPAVDLDSSPVYVVYPRIFSSTGDLAGVTAQLPRIRDLGARIVALMPITPIGQSTGSHPAFGSPYCVHDYYAVNPSYGSPLDLAALVKEAHALGLYVVLDEEINHTAWDNPLIDSHPEYYVHANGAIAQAFGYADVAQLDYSRPDVASYMTTMLSYWMTTYGIDGFRFLTVDVPQGNPTIPLSVWQGLSASLKSVSAGVILWADEEDPAFSAPFAIDNGWTFRGGVPGAATGAGLEQVAKGAPASQLRAAWSAEKSAIRHARFLETWDLDQDLKIYGGLAGARAAATTMFLLDGVPVLWNGEEVGNDSAGPDSPNLIHWDSPNAAEWTSFYQSLFALRAGQSALSHGVTEWVENDAPNAVASFTRTESKGDGASTALVVVNFTEGPVTGTLSAPSGAWRDVSPAPSPGGTHHSLPPAFSLIAHDFAVFVSP